MTVKKYKITELLFSFWYWNKFLQIPVAKKAPTQCLPWWDPLTLASAEYKVYRFFVYKGHFEQFWLSIYSVGRFNVVKCCNHLGN